MSTSTPPNAGHHCSLSNDPQQPLLKAHDASLATALPDDTRFNPAVAMSRPRDLARLQQKVWNGSIPLEIRLANSECRSFDASDPYLINAPRLCYLPFLLPRIHAFFTSYLIDPEVGSSEGWLEYDGVPLKWHYPLGLLYDLYSGSEPARANGTEGSSKHDHEVVETENSLPWKLTVHFTEWPIEQLSKLDTEGKVLHDAFINSVKEADFLRNGTAKTVMSLSKDDSTSLWESVKQHNLTRFNTVNQKLLNPQGTNLRHMPIKLYLPHAPPKSGSDESTPGTFRVVQALVPASSSSRQPQTIGMALNQIIPTLFPSRRAELLAQAVLHGATVPLSAVVEDLVRAASYADGWLHIVVVMMA